jgi:hypothetical protein
LRIDRSAALAGTGQPAILADSERLTVRGRGVRGRAEVSQGFASCTVSTEYLEDPDALRRDVLEPLVLMLLTRRDRTPIHASAFIADGVAVLLAGRTGAGKSCLARAADQAGFQVMSDDTVYVQLEPRLRVWGWPTVVHLLAEDACGAKGPVRLRNGRVKHVVPLRSASQDPLVCDRAVLCVLSPAKESAPRLSPISTAAVEERLWPLDEGFDLLPGPIAQAISSLAAGGAWNLTLSADPAEAVRLLATNLPRLSEFGPGA